MALLRLYLFFSWNITGICSWLMGTYFKKIKVLSRQDYRKYIQRIFTARVEKLIIFSQLRFYFHLYYFIPKLFHCDTQNSCSVHTLVNHTYNTAEIADLHKYFKGKVMVLFNTKPSFVDFKKNYFLENIF